MEWVTREDFLERMTRKQISTGLSQEIILFYPVKFLADKIQHPPDTIGDPIVYPFPNLNWFCICESQGFVLTISSRLHIPDQLYIEAHYHNDVQPSEDWKVIPKLAPLVSFLDARYGLIESRCHYENTGTHYAMVHDEKNAPCYIYEAQSEKEAHNACEALKQAQPKDSYFVMTKEAFESSY